MSRLRVVLLLFALVGLCSPWVEGQDKPRDREPAPRMRGQLPQNWGKLGLTDEQKQKVYKVQNEFRPKIEALQRQISELRDQERKEFQTRQRGPSPSPSSPPTWSRRERSQIRGRHRGRPR